MTEIEFGTKFLKPICLALGFFDSVHFGHRVILEQVKEYSRQIDALPAVFTFSNNVYKAFGSADRLVYTCSERLKLFDELGIESCISTPFNLEFASIEPHEFLNKLISSLNVKRFVCGYDYRFGKDRRGDAILLQEFCAVNDIALTIVPKIELDGVRVSTTAIKELLEIGNVALAGQYLGKNFTIDGRVVHGRNEGHLFGIPTANLVSAQDKLLPKSGVYATYAYVDGNRYISATNVGIKPTFGDLMPGVEVMIKDFSGNLYDKSITIEFVDYIRDIIMFDTPQALAKQIHSDINWRQKCSE